MYEHVLLTVDLSDEGSWKKALPTAVALCRAFGGKLSLMSVVPDVGSPIVSQYFPDDYEEKLVAELTEGLNKIAAENVPGELRPEVTVRVGGIYREILDAAEELGVDLIVMASHRPELSDYLLGPNAARVVRHAECSVMVVRG